MELTCTELCILLFLWSSIRLKHSTQSFRHDWKYPTWILKKLQDLTAVTQQGLLLQVIGKGTLPSTALQSSLIQKNRPGILMIPPRHQSLKDASLKIQSPTKLFILSPYLRKYHTSFQGKVRLFQNILCH